MSYKVDYIKTNKYEMPYVKIDGGKKNIIVIPGMSLKPLFFNGEALESAFSIFLNEYTVYVFDRKKNMNKDYSIEDRCDDLMDACNRLGISDLYLYGVSLGAYISLYMAIKYPSAIKAVMAGSCSYYLNKTGKDYMDHVINYCENKQIDELTKYCLKYIYSKEYNDKYYALLYQSYMDANEYEIKQYCYEAYSFYGVNLFERLKDIKAKVIIVGAKGDLIFGHMDIMEMVKNIKDAKHYIYEGYSHAVYDEAPDFRQRIKGFYDIVK